MNHFLPRRVLAVIFTSLLGVVALSAVTAGPASAATYGRVLLPDSKTEVNVVLEMTGAALADIGLPGAKNG